MRAVSIVSVALAVLACMGVSAAADPQPVEREIIPGSELMTSQEREQYRQRTRAAGSAEERQKVRAEHVKQMRERARVRGLRLAEPLEKAAP
jgi:hypothetical protein